MSFVEIPTSVGQKRSNVGSCEDMHGAKREKKDDKFLSCAKCMKKFSVQKESDYRDHLHQHFSR